MDGSLTCQDLERGHDIGMTQLGGQSSPEDGVLGEGWAGTLGLLYNLQTLTI